MLQKNSKLSNTKKISLKEAWIRDFKKNKILYLMILPVIVFYIIFHYAPLYGALMAFQNYSPRLGISGSKWVGLLHFKNFFLSPDFVRLLRNTLSISITMLICSFPCPILLALFLNEVRCNAFKRTIQTISYLPHFISLVVICGMIKNFVSSDGLIGQIVANVTGSNLSLMNNPNAFLPIYVVSGIWQSIGWNSIIYLSALSAIDHEQYEAADIDGAGRFKKMFHITLPSIKGTMVVMLILAVGGIMGIGYEKIMLLYSPAIYSKSDVISTYVYRLGFETQNWSMSTAVGLFNSVCNLILVVSANKICKKLNGSALW